MLLLVMTPESRRTEVLLLELTTDLREGFTHSTSRMHPLVSSKVLNCESASRQFFQGEGPSAL